MFDKDKLSGHWSVALAYTIFGFNIVFCKNIANSDIVSPIVLFSMRAVCAAVLFWLLSLFLPKERVSGKDLFQIALASLLGLFVPQYTFLEAITMTASIDVSVFGALVPIFTMFFAAFFLKEPITLKKAGGVAISFAGILLLIFNSAASPNGVERSKPLGIVFMLINCMSFAAYLGIFRPLISRYSVCTFMKWMFFFSMLISLPFSTKSLVAIDYSTIPPPVAAEIAFLIFFATFVAYFLIPVGQKRLRPTVVSMYSYLQPIIATVLSVIIGMDSMNWQKLTAIILVFAGVALVNKSRAAQPS